MSRYQKGTTNVDFNEARDSEWQWHQLGHMQSCTLLQTNNHASIPPLKFFTGQMPFLLPNQPCKKSTEGILKTYTINTKWGLQVRVHFPQIRYGLASRPFFKIKSKTFISYLRGRGL